MIKQELKDDLMKAQDLVDIEIKYIYVTFKRKKGRLDCASCLLTVYLLYLSIKHNVRFHLKSETLDSVTYWVEEQKTTLF